jgi:hypothetical protein
MDDTVLTTNNETIIIIVCAPALKEVGSVFAIMGTGIFGARICA